jgi:hypothetical protein
MNRAGEGGFHNKRTKGVKKGKKKKMMRKKEVIVTFGGVCFSSYACPPIVPPSEKLGDGKKLRLSVFVYEYMSTGGEI